MTIRLQHLLIGVLLFLLVTSFVRNANTLNRNTDFFRQLEKEYAREKKRNEKLKLQEANMRDPYELEKMFRDKLGLVKEGEQVIILGPTTTPKPKGPPR
jgi:cell division protein FtsB